MYAKTHTHTETLTVTHSLKDTTMYTHVFHTNTCTENECKLKHTHFILQAFTPHTQAHSPCPSTTHPTISYLILYSMHLFAFSVFVCLCQTHCQQVLKPIAFQPFALSLCHFVLESFSFVTLPLQLFYHLLCCLPIHTVFLTHFLLLHSTVTFICSCISFFACCLLHSLSRFPQLGSLCRFMFLLFFSIRLSISSIPL